MAKSATSYILKTSQCWLYYILFIVFISCVYLSVSNAEPLETKIKESTTGQYQELHFFAEKGVQFTLQKSTDLDQWEDDITFLGNGQQVKLRLYANNANVLPVNGNDNPFETVSVQVRSVTSGGTSVAWVSLEDQSAKQIYLPTTELDATFPISYTGLKNGYYLFLTKNDPKLTIPNNSTLHGKDLSFKNAISAILQSINNDTQNGVAPVKPHRPEAGGLSLKHFWRIQSDKEVDTDGDGVPNVDEIDDGADILDENETPEDRDGDGIPNINDADPNDKAVNWKRVSELPYLVTELTLPYGVDLDDGWHFDLGEGGHVLISKSTLDEWDGDGNAPAKTYFKTYVWDLSTTTWSGALGQPDNIRGIGEAIDAEGNVYGPGTCATHEAVISAGAKYTSLRWTKKADGGWDAAVAEHETELITDFADIENSFTRMNSLYIEGLLDKDSFGLYGLFGKTGRFVISQKRLDHEDRSGYIQRVYSTNSDIGARFALVNKDLQVASYKAAGEPNGWHAITWVESGDGGVNNRFKFSKFTEPSTLTDANPPTGHIRSAMKAIASINPALHPTEINVSDIVIWQSTDEEIQIGQRPDASSNFVWQVSTKADATQRIGGKINGRGEGLSASSLWRNGRWTPLTELVDMTLYPSVEGIDINNSGTILARSGAKLILIKPLNVEVKYVNRDVPHHTWVTESAITDLPFGQPLYSQPPMHFGDNEVSAGDLVSWEIKLPNALASTTNFTWEAEGPENLNPQKVAIFGGIGKKRWRIYDPLNWKPGKYKIRCKVDFAEGDDFTLELDQEIGVRSGEVMVVGWIDAEAITLPDDVILDTSDGSQGEPIGQILNNPLKRLIFMNDIALAEKPKYKLPLVPNLARNYFNAFMIKNSGNSAPPQHFRKPIEGSSMDMVDRQALTDFLSNARNYRLANRLQVKFLVDESGKMKDIIDTHPREAKAGLTTVHLEPEKWGENFVKGVFDNIPAEEGPYHNLINKHGQEFKFNDDQAYSAKFPDSIAQYAQAKISNKGNLSGGSLSQKINGKGIPWIWSEVKFKAPLAQGIVTTSPNHEKFPAIWIYFNGELIEALKDPIESDDLKNFVELGIDLNN